MIRRILGVLAAPILILVLAGPVLAGGWAEIVVDAQTAEPAEPPVEGQPIELGFMVMQHGVTPAGWEQPTVHLTDLQTGKTIESKATPSGADGHFIATVTAPSSGFWTWTVTLRDLASDEIAMPLPVSTADGTAPTLDPTTVLAAIDAVRRDVTQSTTTTLYAEVERLDAQIGFQRTVNDQQRAVIKELEADRATLTEQVATLEQQVTGGGGLPLAGVVLLAVLAGAIAGFAMVWLGGRNGPREVAINQGSAAASPRGSTPA